MGTEILVSLLAPIQTVLKELCKQYGISLNLRHFVHGRYWRQWKVLKSSTQCKHILLSERILTKWAPSWIQTRKRLRGRNEKASYGEWELGWERSNGGGGGECSYNARNILHTQTFTVLVPQMKQAANLVIEDNALILRWTAVNPFLDDTSPKAGWSWSWCFRA